jgi:hypothetical protein
MFNSRASLNVAISALSCILMFVQEESRCTAAGFLISPLQWRTPGPYGTPLAVTERVQGFKPFHSFRVESLSASAFLSLRSLRFAVSLISPVGDVSRACKLNSGNMKFDQHRNYIKNQVHETYQCGKLFSSLPLRCHLKECHCFHPSCAPILLETDFFEVRYAYEERMRTSLRVHVRFCEHVLLPGAGKPLDSPSIVTGRAAGIRVLRITAVTPCTARFPVVTAAMVTTQA